VRKNQGYFDLLYIWGSRLIKIDIIGPNSTFVGQSGTFPQKFTDFKKEDSDEMMSKDAEMVKQALVHDYEIDVTPEAMNMVRLLGG
jgi:hypothetical protein